MKNLINMSHVQHYYVKALFNCSNVYAVVHIIYSTKHNYVEEAHNNLFLVENVNLQ